MQTSSLMTMKIWTPELVQKKAAAENVNPFARQISPSCPLKPLSSNWQGHTACCYGVLITNYCTMLNPRLFWCCHWSSRGLLTGRQEGWSQATYYHPRPREASSTGATWRLSKAQKNENWDSEPGSHWGNSLLKSHCLGWILQSFPCDLPLSL